MKKTLLYKTFVALLCLCLVLSVTGCASSQNQPEEEDPLSIENLDTGIAYTPQGNSQGMEIVAENSAFQLLLDPVSSMVAVYVKSSGRLWKSNLDEDDAASIFNDDVRNEYRSQILLSYFDSSSKEIRYNSYHYAVENNDEFDPTVRYYGRENGLRIVYRIGQNVDDTLMPQVLTAERMEEITSQLSEDDAEYFKFFYEELVYDEVDVELINSYRMQYSNFASGDVYYQLVGNNKLIKRTIYDEYLRPMGIEQNWVQAAYDEAGYTFTWPEAPKFTVPVDYTLTEKGLTVNVPMDQVLYDTHTFRLYSLRVLPFFGAVTGDTKADLFLPDGSGALVSSDTQSFASVSLPFYGADYSVWTKEIAQNMQQAALPVFGISDGTDAFVAYVSDGEAVGSVECHPRNKVYPYAYIGCTYVIHPFETYASNGASARATMQKYASDPYLGNITTNYFFLSGKDVDYVDMAKTVRDYLFGDSQQTVTDDSLRFYLETYGMVLRKENFLGYAYNNDTALTTFEQAKEIVDILNDNGITDLTVRYKNWYSDDYENKISKIGNTKGVIGGNAGLKDFVAYVQEKGGMVYPNLELVMEQYSTSLTDATWHSKYIEGTMINFADSEHWAEGVTVEFERLVVKSDEVLKKLPDVLKKTEQFGADGVALTTVGNRMFSDFTEDRIKYRDAVQDDMIAVLQQAKEKGRVLVDTGNAYTLPYANDVLGLSLSCSDLSFEKTEVPFMPIVLHGHISYAGGALNLSDHYDTQLLKSVEYGSNLYFVLNYAEADMVKYTNYSELYSTNFDHWKDQAISDYQAIAAVLDGCQASEISTHKQIADSVYLTGYANGAAVVVNYSNQVYNYKGVSIPARGFARVDRA